MPWEASIECNMRWGDFLEVQPDRPTSRAHRPHDNFTFDPMLNQRPHCLDRVPPLPPFPTGPQGPWAAPWNSKYQPPGPMEKPMGPQILSCVQHSGLYWDPRVVKNGILAKFWCHGSCFRSFFEQVDLSVFREFISQIGTHGLCCIQWKPSTTYVYYFSIISRTMKSN